MLPYNWKLLKDIHQLTYLDSLSIEVVGQY